MGSFMTLGIPLKMNPIGCEAFGLPQPILTKKHRSLLNRHWELTTKPPSPNRNSKESSVAYELLTTLPITMQAPKEKNETLS
jgi:hypothetical protein